jgi:hypothetical protein
MTMRNGRRLRGPSPKSGPKPPPGPPPTGAEELKAARRTVEEYVEKVLAARRRLDADLLKINQDAMTQRFEKRSRDEIARWARKGAAEKVLRTERASAEEYRVESSGEGLGRLRYTLRVVGGGLKLDGVQRMCEFCLGKGACTHCDGKGCKDCSKTGLCFVCEGRIWEEYSR